MRDATTTTRLWHGLPTVPLVLTEGLQGPPIASQGPGDLRLATVAWSGDRATTAATRCALLAVAGCVLALAGCQQEMAHQPSYKPQQPSNFFPDGRASRPQVPGTIAHNRPEADDPLINYTTASSTRTPSLQAGSLVGIGTQGALGLTTVALGRSKLFAVLDYTDTFPFPVTKDVLERGRERYNIFCVVCHDPSGNGNGKIVQRSFTKPPSYITDRSRGLERRGYSILLRDAPVGYYFEVVTKGYGAMADYSTQVPPKDRWAIIAYIRALQLSQHSPLDDLPPQEKAAALKELEVPR